MAFAAEGLLRLRHELLGQKMCQLVRRRASDGWKTTCVSASARCAAQLQGPGVGGESGEADSVVAWAVLSRSNVLSAERSKRPGLNEVEILKMVNKRIK